VAAVCRSAIILGVSCCLGIILGALFGDSIFSHWGLYSLGYHPNPGLSSTVLYSVKFIIILVSFWTGLTLAPGLAWIGFGIGAGFFILVLPFGASPSSDPVLAP
jgi:hypothetical protein